MGILMSRVLFGKLYEMFLSLWIRVSQSLGLHYHHQNPLGVLKIMIPKPYFRFPESSYLWVRLKLAI